MENEARKSDDFTIRFSLDCMKTNIVDDDPLTEMIRQFLVDFQRIGSLCSGSKRITIDGFILSNNKEKIHYLKKEVINKTER